MNGNLEILENSRTMSPDLENLVLGEEPDTRLGEGTLSFNATPGIHSEASAHIKSWTNVPKNAINVQPAVQADKEDKPVFVNPVLTFGVVSTRTIENDSEKKHVAYTLMIKKKGAQEDPNPAVIERRYSDFLELYKSLRKEYPSLMAGVQFPRKVLVGNFDQGVITERCGGFEEFLEHIGNNQKLRESSSFSTFVQDREFTEAKQWMEKENYEQAVPLLENIFRLLNKLHTDRHPSVLMALCRLVACSYAAGESAQPEKFADLALHRYEAVSDADLLCFYVPLLQLCVRIWWTIGRDKKPLEARLDDLRRRGIRVDGCPTLMDALKAADKN